MDPVAFADVMVSVIGWVMLTLSAVIAGLLMCFFIWHWRRNRGQRKRRPSRVLGLVVNLGHRLGIRPAPAGASR